MKLQNVTPNHRITKWAHGTAQVPPRLQSAQWWSSFPSLPVVGRTRGCCPARPKDNIRQLVSHFSKIWKWLGLGNLHPRKLTWIPNVMLWKKMLPFMAIFGIYLKLRGGVDKQTNESKMRKPIENPATLPISQARLQHALHQVRDLGFKIRQGLFNTWVYRQSKWPDKKTPIIVKMVVPLGMVPLIINPIYTR